MIKIQELTVAFDKKIILENISCNISSHLVILGANGSGKSTLAKAISSLTEYEGTISINTQNIQDFSLIQRAKKLSYIPAKLEIYDNFITVEEFVLLGRFPYKKSMFEYAQSDKEIVQEQLEFLGLSHLAQHTLDTLSSGEQQLILIAQSLAQQSNIIIFDEPTANLDPHNTKLIASTIKKLKEKHQVILITHDIHLASYFDAEVLFIKDNTAQLFKKDFFRDQNLTKLYNANFTNMVLTYD